jgi:PAS domain-containing protein
LDRTTIGHIFIFRTGGLRLAPMTSRYCLPLPTRHAIAVHNARLYQQVSAERERLNAIIEYSGDGVMIINPYRIIQTWNTALANLTGITAEEAIGRPCYEVLNLQDQAGGKFVPYGLPAGYPSPGWPAVRRREHHRADGLAITLANNYAPQTNEEGAYYPVCG